MILTVTGHRPPKVGGYRVPNPLWRELIDAIARELERLRPDVVLTGMALGVDQWTASVCIDLGIPFDGVIPYSDFGSNWPPQSQSEYHYLHGRARSVVDVQGLTPPSRRRQQSWGQLLYARNVWMVQHSDQVLAVWNGSPGGTANCVNYAQSVGKPVNYLQMPERFWQDAGRVEQELSQRRAARMGGVDWAAQRDQTLMTILGPGAEMQRVQLPTGEELRILYPDLPQPAPIVAPPPTTQKESVDRRDAFVPGRLIDLDE